ncbi:MAG: CPBP family intramembrane metalloprotease [Candidatus Micrarchaeota archaeon]|nr:CPBP family intramembrane metalloprotease [Candidatus Micrarchaeota archaeon]
MVFDYSTVDWGNHLIYPTLTTVILIFLYHRYIASKPEPKSPEFRLVYGLCKQIRLKYDSMQSTVLIPVFLALFMFSVLFLLVLITRQNYFVGFGYPTALALFTSSILAPINEEIVFRGLIFWIQGVTLATVIWNFSDRIKKKSKFVAYAPLPQNGVYLMLLIQAALFSFLHFDGNMVIFLFKMLSGLISGGLFYFNNKNLLPAMVFHSLSNTMIILMAGQPIV